LIKAFRLCKAKYKASSGVGAALHGGRWNPAGVEVVYTSSTASLCLLESLANIATDDFMPGTYTLTQVNISGSVAIEYVFDELLPLDWDSLVYRPEPQAFGGQWAAELRSGVLSVPSSILPAERNLILNPAHPSFPGIEFLEPKPFTFDPRLRK